MSIQPILLELPVLPVEPAPAPDPAAIAFSHRLAMLRGEVEPPDSEFPVCIYCGEREKDHQRLCESDTVGDFIHEGKCFLAFMAHPDVKAHFEQEYAAQEEKDDAYARWLREGEMLGVRRKSLIEGFSTLQFQIGDWLIRGEDSEYFVNRIGYKKAEVLTGYKANSLRQFTWVARCFPPSRRIDKLPWAAHQALASLKQEYRHEGLEKAAKFGLKVSEIRRQVKSLPASYWNGVPKTKEEPADEYLGLLEVRYSKWANGLFLEPKLEAELTAAIPRVSKEKREAQAERLKKAAAQLLKLADVLLSSEVPQEPTGGKEPMLLN